MTKPSCEPLFNKNEIFFFGSHPSLEYCFLSNFYPCNFSVDAVVYNCVEQYMMAEKACLFNDTETLLKIMESSSPPVQKRLGRKVKGFVEAYWDQYKEEVVFKGCYNKFNQNQGLKEKLLKTGSASLVEASPYDRIWGIGYSKDDPNLLKERRNWGLNLLGKTLMNVRSTLRDNPMLSSY